MLPGGEFWTKGAGGCWALETDGMACYWMPGSCCLALAGGDSLAVKRGLAVEQGTHTLPAATAQVTGRLCRY